LNHAVHRKELISSDESEKSSEKSSEKMLALLKANPELSAREVAEAMGITSRAWVLTGACSTCGGPVRRLIENES
jgi:predicted HTH transcriptional regulator